MTQSEIRARLVTLYEEMSAHTKDKCANCKGPASCCHVTVCQLMAQDAWFKWGVELKLTGHPKLPYMSEQGCTVAPHLRPLCTVHTCCVEQWGGDMNDRAWTDRYWELRNELSDLEMAMEPVR